MRVGSPAEAATGDQAFLQAMLDAEAALTRAQAAIGLAPVAAAEAVAAAARADRFDLRDLAMRARSGGNPVIPLVKDLSAAAGREAAPFVHRGATSQDILDTAAMLVATRALWPVLADLDRTATALARLAAEHRDTPMPARTLTQHAVPTTFGLTAAGWRGLVLAARDRLAAARRSLPCQLGGAAGTLAAFHAYAEAGGDAGAEGTRPAGESAPTPPESLDRTTTAQADTSPAEQPDLGLRLLAEFAAHTGLAEPVLPWHVLRAPVADLAGALAFTAGALGKLAADILVLSRTEIGEVVEGSGGGSSAMPQKANPVHATLIAAAARQVPALTCVLYASMSAEDERPAGAWHAEWQPLREALRQVGGAARDAAELTEGLRVHPERMRDNLDRTGGLIVSERLAAALSADIGRAGAGQALSRALSRAAEEGLPAALLGEPELAAILPEARLRELTDPTHYSGSAGPLVDRALREQGTA